MGNGRCLSLYLNIISAEGLENVNTITKMKTYVVVTIVGGKKLREQKTLTDKEGGTNPTWNFPMKFMFKEKAARKNSLGLVMKIRTEHILGDRLVGEVRIPLMEIMVDNEPPAIGCQVTNPSGAPRGELTFSYKFVDGTGTAPVSYTPVYEPPQPSHDNQNQPPPKQNNSGQQRSSFFWKNVAANVTAAFISQTLFGEDDN